MIANASSGLAGSRSRSPWLLALLRRELRVLLPVWLGVVGPLAALLAWPQGHSTQWGVLGGILTMIGTISLALLPSALGALSMGHDFAHDTWNITLALPVARTRMLAVKTAVVGLLITLAGVLAFQLAKTQSGGRLPSAQQYDFVVALALAALVCGIVLAPWFTLVCRSAKAGLLLSMSAPFVASAVASLPWSAQPVPAETVGRVWLLLMSALGGIGAAGLWYSFMRLETADRLQSDLSALSGRVQWTQWTTKRAHPSRSVTSVLLGKELRLQTPAGAIGIGLTALWLFTILFPRNAAAFMPLAIVCSSLTALLAGAVGSAEERRLGTLADQLLLPMSLAKQWLLKLAVVLGTGLVLGIFLPLALIVIGPDSFDAPGWTSPGLALVWRWAGAVIGLAIVGLYVSSVARSGFLAAVWALPTVAGFIVVGELLMWAGPWLAHLITGRSPASLTPGYSLIVGGTTAVGLLVPFALQNHRRLDNGGWRVLRQLLWLCATVLGVGVVSMWRP